MQGLTEPPSHMASIPFVSPGFQFCYPMVYVESSGTVLWAGSGLGLSCFSCIPCLVAAKNVWNQVVDFSGLGTSWACLACHAFACSSTNNNVNAGVWIVTSAARSQGSQRPGTATPEYFTWATAILDSSSFAPTQYACFSSSFLHSIIHGCFVFCT